jgi:hypothetical protein
LLLQQWEGGSLRKIESYQVVDGDTILDGRCKYFYKNGELELVKNYEFGKLRGEQFEYYNSGSLRRYVLMSDDTTLRYFRGYGSSNVPIKVYGFPFYYIGLNKYSVVGNEDVQIIFEVADQPELFNEAKIRVFLLPDSLLVHDTTFVIRSFRDAYNFRVPRSGDYNISLELKHLDKYFKDSIYHSGSLFFNASLD